MRSIRSGNWIGETQAKLKSIVEGSKHLLSGPSIPTIKIQDKKIGNRG